MPVNLGEPIDMIDLDLDREGNVIALVVFKEGIQEGPVRRRLVRMSPQGELTVLAKIDTREATTTDDVAVAPSGDIWIVTPQSHPLFRVLRIGAGGEVSVVAWNTPYDTLAVRVSESGEVYFTCSAGLFKIFELPVKQYLPAVTR
jgi:sugar lactone lactonase YvrE